MNFLSLIASYKHRKIKSKLRDIKTIVSKKIVSNSLLAIQTLFLATASFYHTTVRNKGRIAKFTFLTFFFAVASL